MYVDFQALIISCCVCDARVKHRQAVLSNLLHSHLPLRYSSADEEHCSSTPATLAAACDVMRFHPSSSSLERDDTHPQALAPGSSTSSWTPSAVVPALVSSLVFLLARLPAVFLLALLPALLRRATTYISRFLLMSHLILIELATNH